MEAVILALVATIGGCFLVQIFLAKPDMGGVVCRLAAELAAGGVVRGDRHPGRNGHAAQPVLALGAGADPSDRQRRAQQADGLPLLLDRRGDRPQRGVFRQRGDPDLECRGVSPPRDGGRHHRGGVQALACRSWVKGAPILFAIALLCAGQSSTLTGTLAGQIVMEGYLHLRLAPWLRRLITRLIALVPAVVVISLAGEQATQRLLILSQVILSLQLSFAVIPLIHFTSNRKNMGPFATPWWGQVLAWSDGRGHRGAQRQAGSGPGRRLGELGGRLDGAGRPDSPELARGRLASTA